MKKLDYQCAVITTTNHDGYFLFHAVSMGLLKEIGDNSINGESFTIELDTFTKFLSDFIKKEDGADELLLKLGSSIEEYKEPMEDFRKKLEGKENIADFETLPNFIRVPLVITHLQFKTIMLGIEGIPNVEYQDEIQELHKLEAYLQNLVEKSKEKKDTPVDDEKVK